MRRFVPFLLALALAGTPAAAQGVVLTPQAGVGLVGAWHPTVSGGFRASHTPVPEIRRGPDGRMRPVTGGPTYELIASAGATFFQGAHFTALGQAAYLRPVAAGPVSLWGPVAFGAYHPDAVGGGLRVESSFRAVGLTAGPVWARHQNGPRAAVLADVSLYFLRDLLLKGQAHPQS
ncbi:MAG TPA: hypothetical protein VFH27_02225 [Longimicrobiaceae bacterium]|nr:hypothetical protein [Longimicrobiaceae bacterium]